MVVKASVGVTFLALATTVAAQQSSNFTSTDCVDSNGFDSCFQKASDETSSCINAANANGDSVLACQCELYLAEINCVLGSCWNEVRGFISDTDAACCSCCWTRLSGNTGVFVPVPGTGR